MRQEINEAIKHFDYDTLLDIAITFKFITKEQCNKALETGKLPSKATKSYIKKRALADENIAEYVLLNG